MGTRTDRRAEIKGRRGDEFVKKAEAGQRHASGTSKRQDEMKSNRRHPSRGESSLLVSSFSFLYSLPSCLRIFVAFTRSFARARAYPGSLLLFSSLHPWLLLFSFYSRTVKVLHIRSDSNPVQAGKGGGERSEGKTGECAR